MASAENYEYSPASLAVLQSYVQPLCEVSDVMPRDVIADALNCLLLSLSSGLC